MPLWSFLFSSSYNLIAVNIERYISIIAPIYHKTKVCITLAEGTPDRNSEYPALNQKGGIIGEMVLGENLHPRLSSA